MSRGLVPGLASPRPLGGLLPALYQEDPLALRLTTAFDDGLAPILSTLDNQQAYFDPHLAPDDFAEWLASWVGLAVDETWTSELLRSLVARATALYRNRGTAAGVAELVEIYAGGSAEVVDTGGVAWSASPGADLPGDDTCAVRIEVTVDDPAAVDQVRLRAVVDAALPAHVVSTIEVVAR